MLVAFRATSDISYVSLTHAMFNVRSHRRAAADDEGSAPNSCTRSLHSLPEAPCSAAHIPVWLFIAATVCAV